MTAVLGIQGSPRRHGNTQILVEKILDGARDAGATVGMVQLADMTIRECDGCHACWRGEECPKDDDMNGLFQKLVEADAFVFGTPLYWYGPTALMKAFVDRFCYFNCPENRPNIRGKRAVLAVPFEEDNLDAASPLLGMFEKSFAYLELALADAVVVPGVGKKGAILDKPDRLDEAYALGGRLAV